MIEATGLTKHYPGVVAVDGASFSIGKGEIVGLLGPNGAGKSTMMKMITAYLMPTAGSCRVGGHDITSEPAKVKEAIGYLPENNPLYTEMRVYDFLDFRARIKGVASSERKRRVQESIRRTGLTPHATRIISHLSKGLRQRVGLADAIIHNPPLLILDEPTIGLDPVQIQEVRGLISELGQDKTVILSTHILSEVEAICRRVILIKLGKIINDGPIQSLVDKFSAVHQVRFVVNGDNGRAIKEEIESIPGVKSVKWSSGKMQEYVIDASEPASLKRALFEKAVAKKWAVEEIHEVRLSLEAAFIRAVEQ